jgi:hypothetical protein
MPWITARVVDHLLAESARKDRRIAELERQVDNLHRQGFAVTAPPDEPAPPAPQIDGRLADLLAGFEDPEARAAWRAQAEGRIRAGDSPDDIADDLFVSAP